MEKRLFASRVHYIQILAENASFRSPCYMSIAVPFRVNIGRIRSSAIFCESIGFTIIAAVSGYHFAGIIVKTKKFAIKPIDPEEACLQMEMLGHNFYVFLNADTDQVNVVYRRKNGTYGLIEPEF